MQKFLTRKGVIMGTIIQCTAYSHQSLMRVFSPHLSTVVDCIISPVGFPPIYESSTILFCGIQSWLNQSEAMKLFVIILRAGRVLLFILLRKELVRFICKNKSLNKHKEQNCTAPYLVPCPRGESSWKTSLKLRPSMKQRLCFRKEKVALGEMSFQQSSTFR